MAWITRAILWAVLLLRGMAGGGQATENPSLVSPMVVVPETKEIRVLGTIYPARFNTAKGEEAHYHLLIWQRGASANALIETPADDLAFYEALMTLGGKPGDNLTMAAWNERHDKHSTAPRGKVTGSPLDIRISWEANPTGVPVAQAFRPVPDAEDTLAPSLQPLASFAWRFGGNRDRWFNRIPLAPRPGCLACLYSCPSGKVSNGALSIHEYMASPMRFQANTEILPPDGTSVLVTFRLLP